MQCDPQYAMPANAIAPGLGGYQREKTEFGFL
jgi:hypothetical protein